MDLIRRLEVFYLISASLVGTVQATKLGGFSTQIPVKAAQEQSLNGDKPASPQTPRKRRPYDPVLQPPEGSTNTAAARADLRISPCMPAEIDLDNAVLIETGMGNQSAKAKVTVRIRLAQLKARCKNAKLVDGRGRQIRFYNLIGCWGNPPADYEALLKQQAGEIKRLQKRYTVIQIPCAQSIDPSSIN